MIKNNETFLSWFEVPKNDYNSKILKDVQKVFASTEGKCILEWLENTILQQNLSAESSYAQLCWHNGQRSLVLKLKNMIKQKI